jgi:hypothetical protein
MGQDIEPMGSDREVEGSTLKGEVVASSDETEVFQKDSRGVDFRTVSWLHASGIFLKGWECFHLWLESAC